MTDRNMDNVIHLCHKELGMTQKELKKSACNR